METIYSLLTLFVKHGCCFNKAALDQLTIALNKLHCCTYTTSPWEKGLWRHNWIITTHCSTCTRQMAGLLQTGGLEGLGGLQPPPPVFGQTVNPMSTRGQIIPTTVLQAPPPWIFRPCDGPEWGSQTVPKYSLAASMAGWGIFLIYDHSGFARWKKKNTLGTDTSRLEAHAGFFRLLMKWIFDPYVLWPFDKRLIS